MQTSALLFGILMVSFAASETQAQERVPTQLVSENTTLQSADGTIPSMESSIETNETNLPKGCVGNARKVQKDIRASIDGGARCAAASTSTD
jgi:hypothetical protein